MNIYDLARHILELYEDSERAAIDERAMSYEKYTRKMWQLQDGVTSLYDQIKELETKDTNLVAVAEDLLEMYHEAEKSVIWEYSGTIQKDLDSLSDTIAHYREILDKAKGVEEHAP